MRFVYPNLVSSMKEHGLDYKGVAEILGISEHAAYRRLRGLAEWKATEAFRLCEYFGVTNPALLFQCDCK